MSQTIINAHINDQSIQLANLSLVASGSAGVIQFKCDFDNLWRGYGKTAVFYRTEEEVYHVALVDDVATVPSEVLTDEGFFYFGIMGTADNTRTTEVLRVTVVKGAITTATAEPAEPTPNIYQQLVTAVAVERARVNELVAMRGEGVTEYTLNDEYIAGTIKSNGASAEISFTIASLSLVGGGHHYTDYCIIPALAPLAAVELETSNPDINVTIDETLSNGWARLLIENVASSMYTTDMVTTCRAFYPLKNVYINELADIRVGADGTEYETAGEAVRRQCAENDSGGLTGGTILPATVE